MGDKPKEWPTHGQAVNARNVVAENLLSIMNELSDLQSRVNKGETSRLDMTLSISRVERLATVSLMLLIQQKAPVHPDRIEGLMK